METFNKLAGVQDVSSPTERPSQPHVLPTPPPIPDSDTDPLGQTQSQSQSGSRASLPLNRHPSRKSFRSSRHSQARSRSQSRTRDHRHSSAVDLSQYPETPALDQTHIHDALAQHHSAQQAHHQQQPQQQSQTQPTRSHRNSHSTAQTGTTTEDFVWGPTHPCFPHPNPHCSPSSPERLTTRVIRVRRDWLVAGDLYPQFANLYPEILDPLVSDADFRFLISNLNLRLREAFDPFSFRAWVDGFLGLVTGWLWEDLGFTGAKRGVKGLEGFVEEWNRGIREQGREVWVVQPRRTGFMALDFVIPDPGIDGDGEGEGEGFEDEEEQQ
ncbi:hypothetical protein D0867_13340 [Hortaea werneckii]|uniref:Ras modification protein ERF4 n=1 Tax=Hortaea werneckii TaxID=91943 RepID=A0A3M7BBZ8_HORWE|nr:hypothetical protein KC355_g13563 [Hortaea werneckii]RMX95880.1 hypothetical protein D0867_13340 [Hortaea werneckii]RMY37353.1 hypothetical protein D0866_03323 [Hortaea werneckii]